jgi:hypothetical protein
MEITIKIQLDSGKKIELTENEYTELKNKIGNINQNPVYIPYVPDPWPDYQKPIYPYNPIITCSDNTELVNG